jgi:DNA-directed RNA polymerase subunit RPC12/RpoP
MISPCCACDTTDERRIIMGIIDMNENSMSLNDEELMDVTGGAFPGDAPGKGKKANHIMRIACSNCKRPFYANLSKEECKCPMCSHVNIFKG